MTAGPCDEAERGTYLSNVCFLVEEFSRPLFYRQHIRSADEATCTIVLEENGDTIHFNNGDPDQIKFMPQFEMNAVCWTLRGDGVADRDQLYFVQKDSFTVCGPEEGIDVSSLRKAFANLYGKYCDGRKREF